MGLIAMWPWNRTKKERRLNQRVDAPLEARIRILDAGARMPLTEKAGARVVDISRSGCRLAMDSNSVRGFELAQCCKLPGDFLLELSILPPSGGAWILGANLLWIDRRNADPPLYHLGLKYEEPVALPSSYQRLLMRPKGERAGRVAPAPAGAA